MHQRKKLFATNLTRICTIHSRKKQKMNTRRRPEPRRIALRRLARPKTNCSQTHTVTHSSNRHCVLPKEAHSLQHRCPSVACRTTAPPRSQQRLQQKNAHPADPWRTGGDDRHEQHGVGERVLVRPGRRWGGLRLFRRRPWEEDQNGRRRAAHLLCSYFMGS